MSNAKGYDNTAFKRDYIAALVQLRKQGRTYTRPDTGLVVTVFPSGINGRRIDEQIREAQKEL